MPWKLLPIDEVRDSPSSGRSYRTMVIASAALVMAV
jgi:hypothetical protein